MIRQTAASPLKTAALRTPRRLAPMKSAARSCAWKIPSAARMNGMPRVRMRPTTCVGRHALIHSRAEIRASGPAARPKTRPTAMTRPAATRCARLIRSAAMWSGMACVPISLAVSVRRFAPDPSAVIRSLEAAVYRTPAPLAMTRPAATTCVLRTASAAIPRGISFVHSPRRNSARCSVRPPTTAAKPRLETALKHTMDHSATTKSAAKRCAVLSRSAATCSGMSSALLCSHQSSVMPRDELSIMNRSFGRTDLCRAIAGSFAEWFRRMDWI